MRNISICPSASVPAKEKFLPCVPGSVHVLGVPNCLAPDRRFDGTVAPFRTLLDIKKDVCALAKVPAWWCAGGTLYLNGQVIPAAYWKNLYAAPGDVVEFVATPAGKAGNFLMKIVGAIMQVVGAIVACLPGGQPIGLGLMAAGAALTLGADFICPVRPASIGTNNSKDASPTYSLNASSNGMGYDSPIPRIYGRFKVPPRRILDNYTEIDGNDEYLHFVGVIGYGPLAISDIKVGNNPLENYSGVDSYYTNGYAGNETLPDAPGVVYQDSFQIMLTAFDSNNDELPEEDWWVNRMVCAEDQKVTKISFDLMAPQGIYHMDDRANRIADSRSFQAQFRFYDDNGNASPWYGASTVTIKGATVTHSTGWRTEYVYIKDNEIRHGTSNDGEQLARIDQFYGEYRNDDYETYWDIVPDKAALKKYGITYTGEGGTYTFSDGSYTDITTYTLSGNKDQPDTAIRRTYTWNVSKYGYHRYEIRVRPAEAENKDSKYVTATYFTAVRGFDTKAKLIDSDFTKPLSLIHLRIKATNQLNSSLPVITVLAESILPIWNGKNWKGKKKTRNPAAIFLDILRGDANERPKSDEEIDFASIQKWYEWCEQYEYTCDYVFDTQKNVWDALCDVASAGRGSPTLVGGKWGVVWAHKQTDVVGHITTRNISGFASSRTYLDELHGLRCTFNDEDNDYEENTITVYAKGYNKSNASLFQSINLLGVTNKKLASYTGAFRLNQILLLGENYSCTMPLEFLRLRKNDLVRVVRPEVLYGIGAAWLYDYSVDEAGAITSIRWDAQLPMTPTKTYMAIIRLGDGSELSVTGKSSDGLTMTVDTPVSTHIRPRPRDLVMVGVAQQVGRLCIVTSIEPKQNLTATVTFQDYVDALYENDGGKVPAYTACITLPGKLRRSIKAPTINYVRADEWALEAKADGPHPRIYVRWKYNDDATHARVEYRRVVAGTTPTESDWRIVGAAVVGNSVYIPDVDESYDVNATTQTVSRNSITYDVRIQAVNQKTGYTSAWATKTGVVVVGRTAYPPDVARFTATIDEDEGVILSWTPANTADVDYYAITGSAKSNAYGSTYTVKPYRKTGKQSYSIKCVDTLGLVSRNFASASVELNPPAKPDIKSAILLDNGIVVTAQFNKGSFAMSKAVFTYNGQQYTSYDETIIIPAGRAWKAGQTVKVKVEDIFRNVSVESDPFVITECKPKTPEIEMSAIPSSGTITADWQDCTNETEGSPILSYYTVAGEIASNEKSGSAKVKSTHYESMVQTKNYTNKKSFASHTTYDVKADVVAVDKYGTASEHGIATFTVYGPYKPTVVEAELLDNGVNASWTHEDSTWDIRRFTILSCDGTNRQTSTGGDIIFTCPNGWKIGDTLNVSSTDIMGLVSPVSADKVIRHYVPQIPAVTMALEHGTGKIIAEWNDCRNADAAAKGNAPRISYYQVEGGITGAEKSGSARVQSLRYESVVPIDAYTGGTSQDSLGRYIWYCSATVTSFDKYGVSCRDNNSDGTNSYTDNTKRATIYSPAAPVVSYAKLLDNGVNVGWSCKEGSWALSKYIISSCAGTDIQQTATDSLVFPCPAQWKKNATLNITAQDIVGLQGDTCDDYVIKWYPPQSPKPRLGYNKLTGAITIDWQDCRNTSEKNDDGELITPSIAYYTIEGTLANTENVAQTVTVQGTHYETVTPLITYEYGTDPTNGLKVKVGTISTTISAVDKYGITNKDDPKYKDNTVQFKIYPPYNPTNMSIGSSVDGNNLVLNWKDCERSFAIDYYTVYDKYTDVTYKISTNYVVLPSRPAGRYLTKITAYDVLGQASATMDYYITVSGVGGMDVTASLDGADVLIEWSIPDSSFALDYYVVKTDNDVIVNESNLDFEHGDEIGRAKVNYLRVPAGKAGTYTYYVWAVDVAGNVSSNYASYAQVTIEAPKAPSVSVRLDGDGVTLDWIASSNAHTLPIAAWDVVRQYDEERSDGVIQTREVDYGRLDINQTTIPAFNAGEHTFMVRGVDSAGEVGEWGSCDFVVQNPGRVSFMNPVVIDNNIQLYWSQPDFMFFPIREYLVEEVEGPYSMEVGRIDAMFMGITENVAAEYTYGVTPVDMGGNLGTRSTITLQVSQPPNFVFYDSLDSLFNGTKTNFVLDGRGNMLGPVQKNETWEQNVDRMAALAGTDIITHQQKANKGWKTWLEPSLESAAKYVEVIDHGAVVPSSKMNVAISSAILHGSPVISCKIETSLDGVTWNVEAENATAVYVKNFRYSRITITVVGGYVSISKITVDLNIKRLSDFGQVLCQATDNGAGFVSESATPMLTGKWVDFNVDFVDVQSFPRPNVVLDDNNTNKQGYTAFIVFEDVINPKGFRVFVKDKNGNRVTALVDWAAMGV